MAVVRQTLAGVLAGEPRHDRALVDALSEDDIWEFMLQDGHDPEADPNGFHAVYPARVVRRRLGLTEKEFSQALRIPLATLQDWEQGRVAPDAAARALLLIVARNPKAALDALAA